ncbi:MAG: hypothetical protein VSS75_012210, partial [Candidatus Parabeggiatoa sp.]|nr:hypothetical protein [Candidatus Parabeggiatoa sp.]
KRFPVPTDINPNRDLCGLIWCSPLVPFDGKHVMNALKIIEEVVIAHQFEPNIGLNCATDRSIIITVGIVYDREVSGEDQQALNCHNTLLEKLNEAGYIPYRLGIDAMTKLPQPQDDYGKLLHQLKKTLDPNDILSPGRYDFRYTWPDSSLNEN